MCACLHTYVCVYRNHTLQSQQQRWAKGLVELSTIFCMPVTLPPWNFPSPAQQSGGDRDHTLFWWPPEGWGNRNTLQVFNTEIFTTVHSWSQYLVSFSVSTSWFRVWRKSSVAKQFRPLLRRQTAIFSARWGSLCHAAPSFSARRLRSRQRGIHRETANAQLWGRADSRRRWCLSAVSSSLPVQAQGFHLTNLSLKSLATICRRYN